MEIVSLTALFLTNTVHHMRLETASEVISTLQCNIITEIENIFEEIEQIPEEKLSLKEDAYIPHNKWIEFKNQKWGYECLKLVRDIKRSLENTELLISLKFIDEIRKYHKNDWQIKADKLKFKFSEANYKKYKDYKKYERLSLSKISMISDALISMFFEKNRAFYESYIEWMKDINNFFLLKKGEYKIEFEYDFKEYNSLKECVESFSVLDEFDRNNFSDFIFDIFCILDDISRSRQCISNANQEQTKTIFLDEYTNIQNDIINFYYKLFNYPEGTIGIVQDEINNMFWMAAKDVIESYDFLKEKKGLTWDKCQKNKGFKALMQYRLYSYLSSGKVNEFITSCIKAMIADSENKFGIYISEKAQIKNKVWIDENCKIGNCCIEDDVIIYPRVSLMAEKVLVKSGSIVGPDINIEGSIVVTISKGKTE